MVEIVVALVGQWTDLGARTKACEGRCRDATRPTSWPPSRRLAARVAARRFAMNAKSSPGWRGVWGCEGLTAAAWRPSRSASLAGRSTAAPSLPRNHLRPVGHCSCPWPAGRLTRR